VSGEDDPVDVPPVVSGEGDPVDVPPTASGDDEAPVLGPPAAGEGDDDVDPAARSAMVDDDAPPAHVHGRRARRAPGRPDRRSLLTRLPIVVLLTAALTTAVVTDGEADDAAGTPAPPPRPEALMPASSPVDAGSSTWYCAAGTATEGGMADHTVTVFNPTDDDLDATLTVFAGDISAAADPDPADPDSADPDPADPDAPDSDDADSDAPDAADPDAADPDAAGDEPPEPVTAELDLPAGERVEVRLAHLVRAPLASALVEVAAGDVTVEHRVSGEHGADAGPCATSAAPTWHLAWGATSRDARDIVVLFNPFPSGATVDAVFTTEDGRREPVRFQGLPVPAGGVVGIDVGDEVTRSDQVSATFEARSGRVVVEQLQQYDGSLGTRGLALTLGAPEAGETWVFADGEASAPGPTTPAPDDADDDDEDADADGSEDAEDDPRTTERIVVYNPGDERAEVDVRLVPTTDASGPGPQPFGLSIGPGGYQVVDYGDDDRVVAGVPHATVVRSTNGLPVVAARVTADVGPAAQSSGDDPPRRRGEIAAAHGSRLAAPVWRFASVAWRDVEDGSVTFVVFNPDADESVEAHLDLSGTAADASDEDDATAADDPRDASTAPDDATADDATADGATTDDERGDDPTAPVDVPPGARVAIEVDADRLAGATTAVVEADGPVVVDRVVRLGDGRRRALGPGVPAAAGASLLDRLAGDGRLAGTPPT
jgi:hypothetical protein